MKVLSNKEIELVSGAIHIHVNVFQALFTVIGAGILGGPAGAGIAVAAIIGAQGTGNLHELIVNELGEPVQQ